MRRELYVQYVYPRHCSESSLRDHHCYDAIGISGDSFALIELKFLCL
jgi:hypothetical protein